jgi:hypothetical protein
MKIGRVNLRKMRNDAHFQFHTDVKNLIERTGAQKIKIQNLFETYVGAYAVEDKSLKAIVKSEHTEKIKAADILRDDMYAGMTMINSASLKHFDEDVRESAKRLKILFGAYGRITVKALSEQTSAVYNILQELNGKYKADAEKVGISGWVQHLEVYNKTVNDLMNIRFEESAAKFDVSMPDARKKIDVAYRAIVEKIEALTVVEGAANYEVFIKTLNAIVSRYEGGKTVKQKGADGGSSGGSNGENDEDFDDFDDSDNENTGGSGGNSDNGDEYANVPIYNPNKHYTEYRLGDLVRVDEYVYRAIDLGQVHHNPNSVYGNLGWERVN